LSVNYDQVIDVNHSKVKGHGHFMVKASEVSKKPLYYGLPLS
jgi:hypothetical protein